MLKNYLKIAIRNIVRNKVYSFINIFGLSVGLGASILIMLWVMNEFSYNKFNRNLNQIYIVPQIQHYKNTGKFPVLATPTPLALYLKSEFPDIKYASRYTIYSNKKSVSFRDKNFYEMIKYVDPDFFKIFTFHFIEGSPVNALIDPHSVIITKKTAEKFFGHVNVINKTLKIDGRYDLKITGVIKNIPDNSDIKFDILASMKAADNFKIKLDDWGGNWLETFVMLKKGVSYKAESKKIKNVLHQHEQASSTAGDLYLFPFKNYHLFYSFKKIPGGILLVALFSLIALITLMVACINFINLATARSAKRYKEISVKKVVGASRIQIAKQFFSEALLMTFISLIGALLLIELFLPEFNEILRTNLSLNNLPLASVLLIIGVTILTGFFSGLYPSLNLSSFKTILISKGKTGSKSGHAGLRRTLVVCQFGISIFLIISTIVIIMQHHFLVNQKLGFNKENILYFRVNGNIQKSMHAFKNELLKNPDIKNITYASNIPFEIFSNGGGWSWKGKNPKQDVLVAYFGVGYDFTKTFNVKMMKGRFFSQSFPSDTVESAIINESFAKIIGVKKIIGTVLKNGNDHYNIIGVMKDFNFTLMFTRPGPLFIHLSRSPNFVFVKISSNLPGTLSYIKEVYKEFNPDFPFQFHFLNQTYEHNPFFNIITRVGRVFNDFAILAIIISCLGLFGLASYIAEQKTKEIGIRKVLGASEANLVKNLTSQFLIWVIIANIIAWPIAYFLWTKLLEFLPYRIELNLWIFIASGLAALLIAAVTVSFQAVKAATANPVKSLKYE